MSNPWQLYDDLIDLVPTGMRVRDAFMGPWAYVGTDAGTGVAMIAETGPRSSIAERDVVGRDLRDVAALAKSWDFALAAIGTAALTAALNTRHRLSEYPASPAAGLQQRPRLAGRRVAVVGHFAGIEEKLDGVDYFVLERNPTGSDLPDPACEYELADRDEVFITGSALTNKTLPRLLELCGHARVTLLGPSTPFAPEVFAGSVAEIGGSLVVDPGHVRRVFSLGGGIKAARSGLEQFTRILDPEQPSADLESSGGA